MKKSKKIIPWLICLILVFLISLALLKREESNRIDTSKEKIVDLSSDNESYFRNQLLHNMIQGNNKYYGKDNLYQLDDSDPSTQVMIGTYSADRTYNDKANKGEEKGGIIMLKKLDNGQYSIYWEIKSPFLFNPALPRKELRDINNDGIKELITWWNSEFVAGQDTAYNYWIISLNPKTKTYKVLNPIYDQPKYDLDNKLVEGKRVENFDFENLDSLKPYPYLLNRFQTPDIIDKIIRDIDNDGISEIVIYKPQLENFGILDPSPKFIGGKRDLDYSQIWKWDGVKYFLWKEEYIKDEPTVTN